MRMLTLLAITVTVASVSSAEPPTLAERLAPLAHGHQGRVAILAKHLPSGETFALNADEPMPTASLIKVAVMIEAYSQAHEGKVRLTDPLTLAKADMVPGSGILTSHFSSGASFPLRDAIRLMIVYSDNTATNLVLDHIGIRPVNRRMASLGFANTRINAKVFRGSTTSVDPARTQRFGLGSTTARESAGLMEMLHTGKIVSPAASKEMLDHLFQCDDKEKFPRYLPAKVRVAHKTGSVSDARTDAGILYLEKGPVVVCVLTTGNADKSWTADNAGNRLCANVARELVAHYR
jgi:D-alanyl-D-alanine carboxypeptidase (penicillin-binding protein 5/6)/beta-lactamase class A